MQQQPAGQPSQTNPADTDFAWNLPPTFNFGRDVVDLWAKRQPNHLALIWCNTEGDQASFTYAQMARLTNQFAHVLAQAGIVKGDRVMVMLPRVPHWQIAMVACTKLGAVPIPCIEMLTAKDVAYRLAHSGAVGVVTTETSAPKFLQTDQLKARIVLGALPGWLSFDQAMGEAPTTFACADTALEDPAVLYYTSGSTGLPKGVTHASRALYAWRISSLFWHRLTVDDVIWCTADTGWSKAGTSILFSPWSCGSTVLFCDGRFDPRERLAFIERFGVTVFCAAATEFRHLVNEPFTPGALASLRMAISAGESVNPEVLKQWEAKSGVPLVEAFGQTETLMTVANDLHALIKPGSMGKPLPGCQVAILDEHGKPLPDEHKGQLALVLPNPQLMLGYWNDPERTAQTRVSHEGVTYFLMGDMARRDADGYIFYEGRTDDIISSAGYRIGPMEVENALIEHPAVVECAVVGSPDPVRGEVVKAFVVLHPDYPPSLALVEALQAHVKVSTAPYKYPRKISFVEDLPKTVTGKLLRRQLRDAEFAAHAQPPD